MNETAIPVTETLAPPGTLWSRMKSDPQYAPEHLALEAVRRLGPEAARWAERCRVNNPGITCDALAELAVKRFTTLARISGSASGASGLPGAVLDVGVLAWTQSRMVLHVAAAYGHDPVAPERATELLMLQRVHKAAEPARVALGVAAGRDRASRLFTETTARPLTGVMLKLAVRLRHMAGVRAARRAWVHSAATRDLAVRSRLWFRTA
ncbi:hypothetical protein ACQP2F_35420 [Actinoplanes sp. CA-030573]|uniref:hypothetical protein n=1 Tax=Actinoplanes sp. CA-030573 TaxID=3239898 RepID=UPI003D8ECF41